MRDVVPAHTAMTGMCGSTGGAEAEGEGEGEDGCGGEAGREIIRTPTRLILTFVTLTFAATCWRCSRFHLGTGLGLGRAWGWRVEGGWCGLAVWMVNRVRAGGLDGGGCRLGGVDGVGWGSGRWGCGLGGWDNDECTGESEEHSGDYVGHSVWCGVVWCGMVWYGSGVYVYVYLCMCACVHVCMCVCVYVCMYVCVCMCVIDFHLPEEEFHADGWTPLLDHLDDIATLMGGKDTRSCMCICVCVRVNEGEGWGSAGETSG